MPSTSQQVMRKFMVALVAAFCMFLTISLTVAQPLWAAEIVVDTDVDALNNDSSCSLREAIYNAATDTNTYTACGTGSGADTITLSAATTYTLTRISGGGDTYDLSITNAGPITITGAGAGSTIINASGLNSGSRAEKRAFTVSGSSTLVLTDLTLTGGNLSNGNSGAAIRVQNNATAHLRRVIIQENQTLEDGGAVYIGSNATVSVSDSLIQDNEAWNDGGAVYNSGTLTVTASLLTTNVARDRGGAVYNRGQAAITNTTISQNSGPSGSDGGGGIGNNGSTSVLNLAYSTLFGNTSPQNTTGSNIGVWDGDVNVTASIIVGATGNVAPSCETEDSGEIISGGYNIDSGTSCGFSATGDLDSTDPLLGALVNAGGQTNVHPLQANSPAIDIVPASTVGCATTVVADQRGEARPQDGNADSAAACDAGAYELAGQTPGGGGALDPLDITVLTTVIQTGASTLLNPSVALGPASAFAGTPYRFAVEIANLTAGTEAFGVIVHDTLLGLTGATVTQIAPAPGWSCSMDGVQLLCSYTGGLTSSADVLVAEVALTLDPDQPNGTVTHYLQASTLNPDTDLSNNACDLNDSTLGDTTDDCVTFTVQGQADLSINKRALTPSAAPGGFLLYEIEVTNNGPSRLASATVTDTLANGPGVIVSASPNCTVGGTLTTCTVTDLEVGERRSLLVTVQVDDGATSGASITNCADVDDVPSGGNQSCDIATVTAPAPAADMQVLGVSLTSVPFTPGVAEQFQIQVQNNSAAAAQGVIVNFACDAVGSFSVSNLTAPQDSGVALWSVSSGSTFTRISAFPGNSTETLTFTLRAPANAHYTAAGLIDDCRATVSAVNPDATLGNNSAVAAFGSRIEADLSLTKTLLTPQVAAGGLAIYAINVCNAGPADVTGIAVVDTLGANLEAGSLVTSADLSSLAIPAGQCVDVLATAQVNASAAPGALFTNSAAVDISGLALGATTLAAQVDQPASGLVNGQVAVSLAAADIQATSTITDLTAPIVAGQSYQFQIGIENAGPAQAQGVIVHDVLQGLPAGWSVTAIQTDPNWACSAGLTCTRNSAMPVQAETVATVTVQIPAQTVAGVYSHQLAATANNPDSDILNNDAQYAFDVVTTVDMVVQIGNANQPLVLGGGAQIFPIIVSNSGPSDAATAVIDIAVPATLSLDALFAGDVMACTSNLAAGTGQCTIPAILAGDAVTIYAAVRARADTPTGPIQAITATVTAVDNTNNNLPVIAAATSRVDAVADIVVSKTGSASVTVGSNAVYNIVVANNGPSPATGVRVTDTLPSLMGFVSATGATCSAAASAVTCAPFDLAAGESRQITITAALAPNVCYSGSVTNNVVVTGDRYQSGGDNPSPAPNTGNNLAQWTTQVVAEANLSVTKSVVNSPVTAGGLAEFLIQITNNGPGCAPNVFVVDELNGNTNPEGLTQAAYYATESTLGDGNGPFAGAYYACTSGICRRGEALPAGMVDTIRILARVPAGTLAGDYVNQVDVFTDDRLLSANPAISPFVQTTVADFTSCGLADDVVIVNNAGGEIRLPFAIDDNFDAGPLDTNTWTGIGVISGLPYAPTFANGNIEIGFDSRVRSNSTFLYSTVEGRVRFTNGNEQIIGFSTLTGNITGRWAIISTYTNPTRVHAWSNGPSGMQVTELPASINPAVFHDYRIVWTATGVEYWVDGAVVATHARTDLNVPMNAHLTNWYGAGANVLVADSLRVLDYATPGQFTSCALDAREPVSWTNLSWLGQSPANTALQAAVRTSADSTNWSAWEPVTNGGGASGAPARFLQYRFDFTTSQTDLTPQLDEVSIGFERPGGQPATLNLASAYATAPWTVSTAADLSIAKTLLTPGTVAPGGLLQYEIVVTNDGPSVASGLNVTDTLTAGFPAGTQIVAASPECSGAPGTQITCAVDNLWPGQSRDFLVTVQVGANAANGATIQNCAAVNDLPGGVNTACAATATVGNLLPNADLELISLSCSPLLPGSATSDTTCTVTLLNSGAATAANVTLAQRLINAIPQGQSFSVTTSQQAVNPNTLWNCSTGMDCTRTAPMPAGTSDTIAVRFRTLPDTHLNVSSNQPIRFEASVTSSNPDTSLFNNRLIVTPAVEPTANLRVDKVALSQNPAPGSTALFAVTVYNDGFSDVDGVGIEDAIVTGNAAILSIAPAETVYIAAGSSQQFLVAVQIDEDALPGVTVTNQVTVTTGSVNSGLSNLETDTGYNGTINNVLTDSASITVGGELPDADLSVTSTITNNTSPIVAGGLYSFTISVANLGPAQAQGVVVHNLLVDIPGAEIVDVVPAGNWVCSGDLTCTRNGAMSVQGETVATVTVIIPASTAAGVYRHRLAASADSPDPVLANNSSEIYTFAVTTVPALSLNVGNLSNALIAGDVATLLPIQVLNSGPSDAANVEVTVSVPAGFVLTALQPSDLPMFCNLSTAACTLSTLPAGSSRTLYAAVRALPATLPAANVQVLEACIASAETCAAANADVLALADLVLDKRATATVNAGDLVTYTVSVLNAGPSDAQNVQVIDTLPAGVTVESAGVCTENAGIITCPATSLAAGASASYSFQVRTNPAAQPGSSLENVATVSSSTTDLNTLNNFDDADTSIVSLAALSLTKSAGAATVNAGESIGFDIFVTNTGPSTAPNVTVEDALPVGLSLVEASVDLGNGPQPCGGGVCAVGDLAAGASATVRITALADSTLAAGTILINRAQVNSTAAETNLNDNRAEATVTVTTQAQLTLTKEDLLDPVLVNDLAGVDDLAYVLTVANRGPSAAASVRVTDTLPAGVVGRAFVLSSSWTPGPQPGICSGAGELVCDLGTIPAGEQVQIYVAADVQNALLCATDVTNQASAGWTDSSGATATAPVTSTTGLVCDSDVDIEKSGPANVAVGAAATYIVTVTNRGPSPLLTGQLTVADPAPAGLTFTGIGEQSGSCAFSGASPWTNGGVLAVGESCSLTLNYTVSAAACPAGVLFNRAQVTTQLGDTDQAVALTTVDCNTSLDLSLTPNFVPENLVAGTIVDFSLTVENTGNVTAYDVTLTDNVFFPLFGARIVDFYPLGAFSAGECTNTGFCNLGDLAPGASVTVVASVEIDSDQAIFGPNELVKDACVAADNAARFCLADREQIFDEWILSDVALGVTKQTLYDPIVVSGISTAADGFYVLEVFSQGPSDAFGVVISDTLPLGMLISDEPVVTASYSYGAIGLDCSGSVGANTLSCELLTPLPAGETLQIIVAVGFAAESAANFCVAPNNSFTNVAEVQWIDDLDDVERTFSNQVTSNFVCRGDVDVIKSGPAVVTYAQAAAGFTYTVTVQNTGPSPMVAGGLTVTDTLPAGIFFNAAAPVTGGSCLLSTAAQTGDSVIVFTNGSPLAAGASCTVTFGVTTAPNGQTPDPALYTAGDLFNVATVRAANDVAQAVWQTDIDFSTQLTVTKQALGPVVAGQEALFEIVITNTGDAPAFDLLLTDNANARAPVDALGARIVNLSLVGRSAGLCSDGGVCQLDVLPAGQSVTMMATVLINADTQSSEVRQQACVAAANAPSTCAAATEEIDRITDVRIRKDDLGNVLVAGGAPVQYIITVWNENGPSTAYDVTVRDDMFPGFVLVGDLEPGSQRIDCPDVPNASDNVCIIRTLRPGDSVELYATVAAADEAVAAAETPVNRACVVEVNGGVLDEPLCDIESTNVTTQADLALVKNAPASVSAGSLITYTVDVVNLGPSTAQDVRVTDVLPAELTLVNVSASQNGCSSLPCALGAMTVGGRVVVTITARVNETALVGSSIENVATVSTSTTDPNPTNDSDDADTSIITVADLRITKQTDVITATAGLPITYTIRVNNVGPGLARGVLVQDALPAGLTLLQATVTPPTGDPFLCAGTLCAVGDLAAGEQALITLIARVNANYTGPTVTNRATVAAQSFDPVLADNDSGPVITLVTTQADLTIAKRSLLDPAVPGQPLTYEITVANRGPSDAAGVTVDDLLPAGFALATVQSSQGGCSSLPCTLGTIPAGAEATLTLAGAVDAAAVGSLSNTASVTAQTTLINTADDTVTINTALAARADLYVQKTATPTVNAGEAIRYTITVVNQGPSAAQNVTVIDALPAGVTLTDNGGCTLSANTLTCAVGTLAAGLTAQINLTATTASTLTPGTLLENRAVITSTTADSSQADNSAVAVTTLVAAADLSLSKTGPATAVAGTEIEYTLIVTNSGPSMARGVDVKDALPTGMTLVEATIQRSGSGLQLCGGAVCQLGEMAAGETATVIVRALVSPNLAAAAVLTNTAAIFSVTGDANLGNNSDSAVTVVESVADVTVSVLDLSDPVQPTGGFVYDIALTNYGPSMARGVVLTDVLDSNVTFSSVSPACPFNGTSLVCNIGNLRVGETVRFLLAVTAADVPNGTLLVNTATVTTTTPDPAPDNNVDNEITTVQLGFGPSADLSVTKQAALPTIDAGNRVTYTMVVSNAGPVEATDVKLIEVIPAGTRLVAISVNNPSFPSATCALSGICLLGKVPVGVSATVTAVLLVERSYDDIVVNNLVTVLADQIDPRPRNNIALAAVEVIPFVPLPSLAIEKTLERSGEATDGIVPVGERITFTINIANDGELQIVDMPLIDTYDATKLRFVSATPAPSSVALGTLLWENLLPAEASLAPGDAFQVVTVFETVGSSVTSVGGLTENTATVNAAEGENRETAPTVSATATVRVTSPEVAVFKQVHPSTPAVILPGDLITYTLGISNTGDTRLTLIPVQDIFDGDHLTFVSAQIAPTATANEQILWSDVGDIEAGGVLTFTVTFRVTGDVPFIENVAALGGVFDEYSDPAFDLSSSASAEVGVARLGFELDSLPAPNTEIRPGEVVTYYLRLVNRGGIPLTNVTLLTEVPEGTTLIGFTEVPQPRSAAVEWTEPTTSGGGVYEWLFGTLAVNQSFETLMLVRVNSDTTQQVIRMDAAYSSNETLAGQSNELIHPLSPTAITLEYFTVTQTANGVLVRWKTLAEVNSWGFYVLRSVHGQSERMRINPTLIPATGAGSVYEYLDTSAQAGVIYDYWLQEVELDGGTLEYGPTVIGQGVERVYLPAVER